MTEILRISVPLTVWLAAFSAVYGLEGLVCSPRWPSDARAGHVALMGTWLLAIAIQAALILVLRRPRWASPSPFLHGLSLSLAFVALVATVWTLFPVVATSLCL